MHTWQFKEAKAKLTECVNQAKTAPQVIARHGKPEVILLSLEMYEQLISAYGNIANFFRHSPLVDSGIQLERDNSSTRDIGL